MRINKEVLSLEIADRVDGMTKMKSREVIDTLFDLIGEHVKKKESVVIHGFGTFKIYVAKEKLINDIFNPGQKISVKPRYKLRLDVGEDLKRKVALLNDLYASDFEEDEDY